MNDRENENGCGCVREDLLLRGYESVNGTRCLLRDCGGAVMNIRCEHGRNQRNEQNEGIYCLRNVHVHACAHDCCVPLYYDCDGAG